MNTLADVPPSDGVIVAVSGGKDSVAALDLCRRHFGRVEAYHLYVVPGVGFVERYLDYLERRYSIQIHRRLHFLLARYLRQGNLRGVRLDVPALRPREIEEAERRRTGLRWIASGEKKADSLQRRGMLSAGGAVQAGRGRLYPLADWTEAGVFAHLRKQSVPLAPDYALWGRSWGYDLSGKFLAAIRSRWPDDFAKIVAMFPLAPAEADWWERHGAAQEKARRARRGRRTTNSVEADPPPGVHDPQSPPRPDQPGPLQPADDRPVGPA